ncbi:hypothetical protein QBC39DRAFT_375120 [Podospora conica]|nr:hypothetical protein QBC39DRAFT_375120 [Schizothecium conicum]
MIRHAKGDSKNKPVKEETEETEATPKPVETPKTPTKPEDKLVIALDFGTTFSGIAYSFKDQKDPKVVAITNWPDTHNDEP